MRRSRTAKEATEMRISVSRGLMVFMMFSIYSCMSLSLIALSGRPGLHAGMAGSRCTSSGKGFKPVIRIVITNDRGHSGAGAFGRLKMQSASSPAPWMPASFLKSGCNIAYALRMHGTRTMWLRCRGGFCVFSGSPARSGPVDFGASEPMARIVLTAMKFDPDIRSAATIRYTPGIIRIIEDLMLETCSFDRGNAPPGTRTMDWGVASCCRSGVPDVIFDRGASRSESQWYGSLARIPGKWRRLSAG